MLWDLIFSENIVVSISDKKKSKKITKMSLVNVKKILEVELNLHDSPMSEESRLCSAGYK